MTAIEVDPKIARIARVVGAVCFCAGWAMFAVAVFAWITGRSL